MRKKFIELADLSYWLGSKIIIIIKQYRPSVNCDIIGCLHYLMQNNAKPVNVQGRFNS